jgi:hypothetical protein
LVAAGAWAALVDSVVGDAADVAVGAVAAVAIGALPSTTGVATGPLPPLRPVMMIVAIPATTERSAAVSRKRRMLKTDGFRDAGEVLFMVFSSVTRTARRSGCDAGRMAGPQRPSRSRSPSQS